MQIWLMDRSDPNRSLVIGEETRATEESSLYMEKVTEYTNQL